MLSSNTVVLRPFVSVFLTADEKSLFCAFIASKYFKNNISISFSVFDMSYSINESIHDRVYTIKFIVEKYVPYFAVWLTVKTLYRYPNRSWNENTES